MHILPFPPWRMFCCYAPVKFAASLAFASALVLTACNTLVTRRDLYSPSKGSGPYSKIIKESTYHRGVQPQPHAPTMQVPPSGPEELATLPE
jgi:hypothetical protein